MRFILLSILLLLPQGLLLARSVVPGRIVTPSLNLFSSKNEILPDGDVRVSVTTYSEHGSFQKKGAQVILPRDQYEAFKKLALPVFEMIPNKRSGTRESQGRRGTAFSIGNNLVITNFHVLDTAKSSTQCGNFEVKDHRDHSFPCKKVHFCSSKEDVCLIEMGSHTETERDCFFCRGTKVEVSLAQGPALKLKESPLPKEDPRALTTAIGNSHGFGIHLAQGAGLSLINHYLIFYAPITQGNSGGPLLNEEGDVIGIVKAESQDRIGDDASITYNVAAPTEIIIPLIREALQNDPKTLEKFNQSVVQ